MRRICESSCSLISSLFALVAVLIILTGSVLCQAGKYADFVVLGNDPQKVNASQIKDIHVIATILGGVTTFTTETKRRRSITFD